mgnify:CR=1 FL=1
MLRPAAKHGVSWSLTDTEKTRSEKIYPFFFHSFYYLYFLKKYPRNEIRNVQQV